MVQLINSGFLETTYNQFLTIFPEQVHWLISLIILLSLAIAFIKLIRYHWLFIFILIILIPALIPIFKSFFLSLWNFILFVWAKVGFSLKFFKNYS